MTDNLASTFDGGSDRLAESPAHRAPPDRLEGLLTQLLPQPPQNPMPLAQDQLMLALQFRVIPAGVDHPIPTVRACLRPQILIAPRSLDTPAPHQPYRSRANHQP
ncbi:MAG TPA: hypothetical protein P5555_20925 [Candidatus Paceibacterota bacterium]|nr:hypothetical protein [Verrucomicrobiota bacterium]HRZ47646.1 hypothetical protein [Candidatus Paceibacterota bacterium]